MKSLKSFVVKTVIGTTTVMAVYVVGYVFFLCGAVMSPVTVYAERIEHIEVPVTEIPPILHKIAKCESGGSHYDKNGQVLINATQDAGKYQINVPIWGKTAKDMELDLFDEKDNEAFALWLFYNKGSAPWVHSSDCWNK